MRFTKKLSSLDKEDVSIAGGKGASLGEMLKTGIPAPQGFVVLSAAFEYFIEKTDLNIEIDSILDSVDIKKMHTIENASENISALILNAKVPKEIIDEIQESFKKMDAAFVAVRSSATSEDSAEAAWAGQLESYLNTKEENLLENIKRCWASLFTPRAIFYRFEKKLHKDHISVAVVVQEMIESEVSGIAFSVHPVTQDRNQIIIEAGFGLGEAIVSGQITPDSYVVEKEVWLIADKNVNKQKRMLVRSSSGGNEWKEMDKEKAKTQALSDNEIIELSKLIVKIENHFGFPVDVEFAREKGKFYIVQSRPITTLTDNAHPDKIKDIKEDKYIIPRVRVSALTPAYWNPVLQTSKDIEKIYGDRLSKICYIFWDGMLKGIVLNRDWKQLGKHICEQMMPNNDYFNKICSLAEKAKEEILSWLKQNSFQSYPQLALSELANKATEIKKLFMLYDAATVPAWFIAGDYIAEKIFAKLKLSENDFDIISLPEEKTQATQMEIDILEAAQSSDIKKASEELAKKYYWMPFGYDGPVIWTENYFVNKLKSVNKNKANEELEKIKSRDKEMLQKRQKICSKLSSGQLRFIDIIHKITVFTDERKMLDFQLFYHYSKILEAISKQTKIPFKNLKYLLTEELAGINSDTKLLKKISDKRINNEFVIIAESGQARIGSAKELNKLKAEISSPQQGKDIKGSVACRGEKSTYQASVKILLSSKECDKVKNGDIIVAAMTTPDYAPAMKKALGFITDEGGVTCHAAIVSREMNKPCIIGTKTATQILKDGDMVEIDAENGIVKIIKKK